MRFGLAAILGGFLCVASSQACELGVYTYDSIAAKGGLGPIIFPRFEKLTGCHVRVVASGDAIQTLSRVEIDLKRGKPVADVFLGLDNLLWERARKSIETDSSVAKGISNLLQPEIREVPRRFPGLVPYDYGALSFVADSEQLAKGPRAELKNLNDLLKPEWKRNFILEDPRTSSPGLQFVLYTKEVLGEGFGNFWRNLSGRWLAMPEGWDAAYGVFLKGQAPLVWSYVTSEAYHRGQGSTRYQAILFGDGQPIQVEGAAIIRGSASRELARKFLRFLVSDQVQERIAETNWMWPVKKSTPLPKNFLLLPKVDHPRILAGANSSAVLKEWSEAIHW